MIKVLIKARGKHAETVETLARIWKTSEEETLRGLVDAALENATTRLEQYRRAEEMKNADPVIKS